MEDAARLRPYETKDLRHFSSDPSRRKILGEAMFTLGLDYGTNSVRALIVRCSDGAEFGTCTVAYPSGREGVLLDYIHGHRKHIARVDRYPDVRRRSVVELAERCSWEAEHARQVAALALTMFDFTKRIHGLGDREREWLEYAGFLHDIGNHISYEKHHRHSYYLIKNGDLRGFEPDEIEIMALVTRYHRRATPKDDHIGQQDLNKKNRRAVEILSAFLRLAETLDRSRHGVVRGIEMRERLGELRIKVQAVGDAELEVWAAHKQAKALEEALGRRIRIEKVPYRKGLKVVNTELTRQKLPRNPQRIS